ncbi:hypothetical protein [Herbidospora mongoliensis]|uniref:hypothetical protein n=1 Tax=Herbidospora mongoliensis TaxID=688067 RepID=UPI00082DE517|nr:hypothetical protein [Herbidospora mongoliensis]
MGKVRSMMRRLFNSDVEADDTPSGPQPGAVGLGSHRRADLVVRLGARPSWRAGEHARVAVDVSRLMPQVGEGCRYQIALR